MMAAEYSYAFNGAAPLGNTNIGQQRQQQQLQGSEASMTSGSFPFGGVAVPSAAMMMDPRAFGVAPQVPATSPITTTTMRTIPSSAAPSLSSGYSPALGANMFISTAVANGPGLFAHSHPTSGAQQGGMAYSQNHMNDSNNNATAMWMQMQHLLSMQTWWLFHGQQECAKIQQELVLSQEQVHALTMENAMLKEELRRCREQLVHKQQQQQQQQPPTPPQQQLQQEHFADQELRNVQSDKNVCSGFHSNEMPSVTEGRDVCLEADLIERLSDKGSSSSSRQVEEASPIPDDDDPSKAPSVAKKDQASSSLALPLSSSSSSSASASSPTTTKSTPQNVLTATHTVVSGKSTPSLSSSVTADEIRDAFDMMDDNTIAKAILERNASRSGYKARVGPLTLALEHHLHDEQQQHNHDPPLLSLSRRHDDMVEHDDDDALIEPVLSRQHARHGTHHHHDPNSASLVVVKESQTKTKEHDHIPSSTSFNETQEEKKEQDKEQDKLISTTLLGVTSPDHSIPLTDGKRGDDPDELHLPLSVQVGANQNEESEPPLLEKRPSTDRPEDLNHHYPSSDPQQQQQQPPKQGGKGVTEIDDDEETIPFHVPRILTFQQVPLIEEISSGTIDTTVWRSPGLYASKSQELHGVLNNYGWLNPRSVSDDDRTDVTSTFDEDREEVVDRPVADPYGDMGIYNGIVLKSTGLPHGFGRMLYEEEDRIYEGTWRHGRWHGSGKSYFPNGDYYEGEYHFDRRHGRGRYEWADGRIYDGIFQDDHRHGKGHFIWPNRAEYLGDFVRGQREGYGVYVSNGGVYEGGWKNGQYQGFGIAQWPDGRTYKGHFESGKEHGEGIEMLADGTVRHDGLWIHGQPIKELQSPSAAPQTTNRSK